MKFNIKAKLFTIIILIQILGVLVHVQLRAKWSSQSDESVELCVISNYFNPASFKSRYVSYKRFEQHMSRFKVRLITIELAINNQTFQVTNPQNPNHIQMRTNDVLWYKENLINIAFKRNRHVCKYVAWIDLEVEFLNENWVEDTIAALGKHKVVQMFEVVRILGQDSEVIEAHQGFGRCYATEKKINYGTNRTYLDLMNKYNQTKLNKVYCTAGYGWAAVSNAFISINGLYERAIVGDGDYIAANSYVGSILHGFFKSGNFSEDVTKWQLKSYEHINGSVGYVKGQINHLYHGDRANRHYVDRRSILDNYNPNKDLYYNNNGLLHLSQSAKLLSNSIKDYFISRKEDLKL